MNTGCSVCVVPQVSRKFCLVSEESRFNRWGRVFNPKSVKEDEEVIKIWWTSVTVSQRFTERPLRFSISSTETKCVKGIIK